MITGKLFLSCCYSVPLMASDIAFCSSLQSFSNEGLRICREKYTKKNHASKQQKNPRGFILFQSLCCSSLCILGVSLNFHIWILSKFALCAEITSSDVITVFFSWLDLVSPAVINLHLCLSSYSCLWFLHRWLVGNVTNFFFYFNIG